MRKQQVMGKFRPVWSVDIRGQCRGGCRQRFIQGDLNDAKLRQKLAGLSPDFAWASVPCEDFSYANKSQKRRNKGRRTLNAVLKLFAEMRKKKRHFVGMIENPRGYMRDLSDGCLRGWTYIEADHCMYSTTNKYRKRADLWVRREMARHFSFKLCIGSNCRWARWNAYTKRWNHPQVAQAGPGVVKVGPGTYKTIPGTSEYSTRIQIPSKLCASVVWQVKQLLLSRP